jgi:hypothetical protein
MRAGYFPGQEIAGKRRIVRDTSIGPLQYQHEKRYGGVRRTSNVLTCCAAIGSVTMVLLIQ